MIIRTGHAGGFILANPVRLTESIFIKFINEQDFVFQEKYLQNQHCSVKKRSRQTRTNSGSGPNQGGLVGPVTAQTHEHTCGRQRRGVSNTLRSASQSFFHLQNHHSLPCYAILKNSTPTLQIQFSKEIPIPRQPGNSIPSLISLSSFFSLQFLFN